MNSEEILLSTVLYHYFNCSVHCNCVLVVWAASYSVCGLVCVCTFLSLGSLIPVASFSYVLVLTVALCRTMLVVINLRIVYAANVTLPV